MSNDDSNVPDGPLKPGESFGYYRVVRPLGRGGMGFVYEVEHATLKKRYALKMMSPELLEDATTAERFIQEARVMAGLEHPRLVRVEDFGDHEGIFWLRMELIQGVNTYKGLAISLEEIMDKSGGRLRESAVIDYATDILDGLSYAHQMGIVHRDMKPSNILLNPDGAKISDFGLVRLAKEEWFQTKVRLTVNQPNPSGGTGSMGSSSMSFLGTYEFMSPEQKAGKEADYRSDLYSVGLIVYRMLTGQQSLSLKPPSQLVNDISEEWDDWCFRALENDREARFQSADEMLEAMPEPLRKEDVEAPERDASKAADQTQYPFRKTRAPFNESAPSGKKKKGGKKTEEDEPELEPEPEPATQSGGGNGIAGFAIGAGIMLVIAAVAIYFFFPLGQPAAEEANTQPAEANTAAAAMDPAYLASLGELKAKLQALEGKLEEDDERKPRVSQLRTTVEKLIQAPGGNQLTGSQLESVLQKVDQMDVDITAQASNSESEPSPAPPQTSSESETEPDKLNQGIIENRYVGPRGYRIKLPDGFLVDRYEDWIELDNSKEATLIKKWHENTIDKCIYQESFLIFTDTHVIHFSIVQWPGPNLDEMGLTGRTRSFKQALRLSSDDINVMEDRANRRLMRRSQLPTPNPARLGIEYVVLGRGNMFYIFRAESEPENLDLLYSALRKLGTALVEG